MKNLKILNYIMFIIISMFSLSSCINDDLTLCVVENRIYFDYTPLSRSTGSGINPDEIMKINLYVFDENGNFVREYVDDKPVIGNRSYISVADLSKGKYKFIAWGNLGDQYAVNKALEAGTTNMRDLQVMLNGIKDNKANDLPYSLFYATHLGLDMVEIIDLVPQDIHLTLLNKTYKINVEVIGFDSTNVANNKYRVDIADNNGVYDFNNNFVNSENFSYSSILTLNESGNYILNTSLYVLQLSEAHKNPLIKIINDKTNSELISTELIDLILKANSMGASVDFNKTHEFDVRFEFDPNGSLECNVYINGYNVINQGGQGLG